MQRTPRYFLSFLTSLLFISVLTGQTKLDERGLLAHTTYFQIEGRSQFDSTAKSILSEELSQAKIVAIAELHQSVELSRFTTALVRLGSIYGYNDFALEQGPISATYTESLFYRPKRISTETKSLNVVYGIKSQGRGPLVFTDKVEDQWFLQALKDNNFQLWGLDQEYALSYEMHLDSLFAMLENPSSTINDQYQNLKRVIRDGGHQSFSKGKSQYNCNLTQNSGLLSFFKNFKDDDEAQHLIDAMKASWDIYCLSERGAYSNQIRADYMKANFEKMWSAMQSTALAPKLLMKFGNVHLTRGLSPFGVDDLGKHLAENVAESPKDLLIIRHVRRFQNGKDLQGRKGYESTSFFMTVGKKDQWALIDLRPFREQLANGSMTANEKATFEIISYDMMLIPPDDQNSGKLF